MSQVSQLSPELARGVLQLARALSAAARNWSLYPPEHPAQVASMERLRDAIRQSTLGSAFGFGITPETLLIEGVPAGSADSIADTAAFLHDRDLAQIGFVGDVSAEALTSLMKLLALDPAERRRRGGPAAIWSADGDPSILIGQIDYETLLARKQDEIKEPAKRDDLWRSIVLAIAGGQKTVFDERAQERLLAIAGSATDIADLATAVAAPKCAVDGSPMITSQAAVVLAAFRHLTSIVSVMAPERLSEVMGNLATAAGQLDPHVVMQVMKGEDDPHDQTPVVKNLTAAFDDGKVAQLLATALAIDGQASDRLATIFNTIAPDEERKDRILTLTRNLLSETDFGKSDKFQTLWQSAEELLVSYNEKPYVSEQYRAALDGVGGRADRMAAAGDAPPELGEWLETLGQDNVRRLSVIMLIDLFAIERDQARAEEIAYDLESLAEDLMMSGAYEDASSVVAALAERAATPAAIGRDAARLALDRLGESLAMRESALLVGDIDEATWTTVRRIFDRVGATTVEALKPLVTTEADTPGSVRAGDTIVSFGEAAVARLESLVSDNQWFVQRNGARLLGRIALPSAVPLLQPLLRKADPRVARETVVALSAIPDPSAARAIHTVLRTATGALRRAVIDALVADRDARVVPMLVRILQESQPLRSDHEVVLETIDALGKVGHADGVPVLATTIAQRAFLRRTKLRALKQRGVAALRAIAGDAADAVLRDAAVRGDRMLRKVIAAPPAARSS